MAASARGWSAYPSKLSADMLDRRPSAKTGREQMQQSIYSITSSVMASTPGGIVRPRPLAVLRLMTVGCWTGRSLALAPLRIRST